MPEQQLADLPYAAALTRHAGGLDSAESYDTVHFDRLEFDGAQASGSRFLECAFTQVTFQGGSLRRATFSQVWLRDFRMVSASLVETGWADATLIGGIAAGVEAFGARLDRVVFSGCKLDSVNFREAVLTDVVFDDCVLSGVDFGGARIARTSFPGSRLTGTSLRQVTLDRVDLRGAELGITVDPDSLRGAIVSAAQLAVMAPLLAESMGITVTDDDDPARPSQGMSRAPAHPAR